MTEKNELKEEDLEKAAGGMEEKQTTCPICGVMDWQKSTKEGYFTLKNSGRRVYCVEWRCLTCNGIYYVNYYNSKEKFSSDEIE